MKAQVARKDSDTETPNKLPNSDNSHFVTDKEAKKGPDSSIPYMPYSKITGGNAQKK